jgi:hypothetical protein
LKPQDGNSPQYYSASILFIADSIVLRATNAYELEMIRFR